MKQKIFSVNFNLGFSIEKFVIEIKRIYFVLFIILFIQGVREKFVKQMSSLEKHSTIHKIYILMTLK